MSLFSLAFWKFAFERAVKTIAQAGIAAIGVNSLGITSVDWASIGSIAALAGLVSVATSLTSFSGGGTIPAAVVTPVTVSPVILPVYPTSATDTPSILPATYTAPAVTPTAGD